MSSGNDYTPLNETHASVRDALNSHVEQDGPTRPEGHYGQTATWAMDPSLPAQQASANEMIKRNAAARGDSREDLQQHVDDAKQGQASALTNGDTKPPDDERQKRIEARAKEIEQQWAQAREQSLSHER
jgi:hypothetical protein